MINGEALTYSEECRYLALSEDINNGNRLYLRLLYSSKCLEVVNDLIVNKNGSNYCKSFFSTIDIDLLILEQQARFKNLKKNLIRSSALVEKFFETKELDGYLSDFINSTHFWNGKGRSLFENFSYFLYNQLDEKDIRRLPLKILGIQSGIGVITQKSCPWKDVISKNKIEKSEGTVKREFFFTQFNLFTPAVELKPLTELIKIKKSKNHYKVAVALFETGEVQLFSNPIQILK